MIEPEIVPEFVDPDTNSRVHTMLYSIVQHNRVVQFCCCLLRLINCSFMSRGLSFLLFGIRNTPEALSHFTCVIGGTKITNVSAALVLVKDGFFKCTSIMLMLVLQVPLSCPKCQDMPPDDVHELACQATHGETL